MNNEQTERIEILADENAELREELEQEYESRCRIKHSLDNERIIFKKRLEELRAEKERLVRAEEGAKIAYQTLIDEKQDLQLKLEKTERLYQNSISQIQQQHSQLTQAQAQVAALVEAIEYSISLTGSGSPPVLKITFVEPILYHIDVDTQATADAHDARVREAAIKGFTQQILHGDATHKKWLIDEADRYLKSLLPTKEGV